MFSQTFLVPYFRRYHEHSFCPYLSIPRRTDKSLKRIIYGLFVTIWVYLKRFGIEYCNICLYHHRRLRHHHHHHHHCLSVCLSFPYALTGPRLTLGSVVPSNCLEEVIEPATLNPLCYPNSYLSELQPETAVPDFH